MGELTDAELLAEAEKLLTVDHLKNDIALTEKMDLQAFVPVTLLQERIQLWKNDIWVDLWKLTEWIGKSKTIALNNDKTLVRPVLEPERKTLLFRDVPKSVTEQ